MIAHSKSKAYQEVRLLAQSVSKNQQLNGEICPLCRGGTGNEKSLNIYNRHDGIVFFICHRASCSWYGRVYANGNINSGHADGPANQPTFVKREFKGKTRQLNQDERDLLRAFYGLTYKEIGWYRLAIAEESGRLVVPILGPNTQQRGVITRGLPTAQVEGPKADPYRVLDEIWQGWFWLAQSSFNQIILVEDVFSAMKAARFCTSIALLGTNLGLDALYEIMRFSDSIVLALDKDASSKALSYQAKYKFICPNLRVVLLDKDLKYKQDSEIKELLV